MASVYEIITDRIMEQLEKGTVPWHKPWASDEDTQNLISKKPYKGINVFLLHSRGFASPYWVSFKQCKELGGHVKAGEKGTPVIFWKRDAYVKENEDGEQEQREGWILRYYTVFNVDQTEGIKPEKIPALSEKDFDPIEECERIAFEMPKKPEVKHGEARAYYRPSSDFVNMPEQSLFDNAEAYYSTLFHELGHSTGHHSRLDRKGVSGEDGEWSAFGSAPYAKEELVAEMTSAFLCGHVGISPMVQDNEAAYIASWLKRLRNDKQVLIVAAGQAQKAADFILGK